jgi:dCMP deaminase
MHDKKRIWAKWDRRFLELAETVAGWSKDPSTKTGAVIVRPDKTVVSLGYNGFPRRIKDDKKLYENREAKYKRVVHCEMNALISSRERIEGYTLYTWPFFSCARCVVHFIQAGIDRCVAPKIPEELKERWEKELELAVALCKEANVEVTLL